MALPRMMGNSPLIPARVRHQIPETLSSFQNVPLIISNLSSGSEWARKTNRWIVPAHPGLDGESGQKTPS